MCARLDQSSAKSDHAHALVGWPSTPAVTLLPDLHLTHSLFAEHMVTRRDARAVHLAETDRALLIRSSL